MSVKMFYCSNAGKLGPRGLPGEMGTRGKPGNQSSGGCPAGYFVVSGGDWAGPCSGQPHQSGNEVVTLHNVNCFF